MWKTGSDGYIYSIFYLTTNFEKCRYIKWKQRTGLSIAKKGGEKMKESSKKVVAYDNRFNSLKLSVLTKLELNILNFFLYSLKDKEENDVIIPLADIRKYAKIKRTDNQKLIANLTNDKGLIFSLGDKLSRMQIPVSFEEAGIKFNGKFNLFKGYADL